MQVSIVIPCFNARRWIGEALESIYAQGFDDLETLVIDDGSTDGSADVVRRAFPSARVTSIAHAGPSYARNVGTQAASGVYLQYLDADDRLAPGKLATQVNALEREGADVAYGDWAELVEQPDGTYQPGRVTHRHLGETPELALFTNFWCPPAVYLFRRSIIEKVGGWREDLPVIQDARFTLDCALHGATFAYCPGMMAYYRRHNGNSLSQRDSKAFTRDCLLNAQQVEAWWRTHGGIAAERKQALLTVYLYVARASYRNDTATFEQAYEALEQLQPGYCPPAPWHLALISKVVGYRRGEAVAYHYRRLKTHLQPWRNRRF